MSHLVTIAPGHELRDDAAAAYLRMRAAGCPAGINSSTRSYAQQDEWYRHQGEPGYPPMADHPDRSKHVWRPTSTTDKGARALDLPEPARAWVRAHGAEYGFMRDRVGGEPWHMEYEAEHDQHEGEDIVNEKQLRDAVRAEQWKLWKEAAEGKTPTGKAMRNAVVSLVGTALADSTDEIASGILAGLPVGVLTKAQVRQIVEDGVTSVLTNGVRR